MKNDFWKYVVPSLITFLVTGIYVSVDGFFVGRVVGDIGLASINMAWPLASLILALGTGIGMGGAINISNYMGAGKKDKADKTLGNTIITLALASITLSAVLLLFGKPLLQLMGAEGKLLELSYGYVQILAAGAVFQIFGTGITPLLRNQNKAWIAMALMLANFAIDTILSGVFVMLLGLGVQGAALATLVGQCIAVVPALIILFHKENRVSSSCYRLRKVTVGHIVKAGMPIASLSIIPSVTILVINKQALSYGGTTAVAAYAVVSYILTIGQLLSQGVGEGCQPLISFYYGANDQKAVKQLKRWAYTLGFTINIVLMSVIIILRMLIPKIFGVSEETARILHLALPLCALSLPLYAASRVTTEYFNAIKKSKNASIMVYGEALVLLPICAFTLPLALELNGVWGTIVLVQFILLMVAVFLQMKSRATTSPDYPNHNRLYGSVKNHK